MLSRLTLSMRLALGFGFALVLLLITAGVGMWQLHTIRGSVQDILEKDWPKARLATEVRDLATQNGLNLLLLFLPGNHTDVRLQVADARARITDNLAKLDALVYRPEGKAHLANTRERREAYVASMQKVSALIDAQNTADAQRVLMAEALPRLAALRESLQEFVDYQGKVLDTSGATAEKSLTNARGVTIGVILCAAVALTLISLATTRSVTRPLGGEPDQARAVVQRIASGDFTVPVQVAPGDRHSVMAEMARMQTQLRHTISRIASNAEQVAAASQQLAAASEQISAGTAAQCESASAMAATVEELTVSINQVAQNASDAHKVSDRAGAMAANGERVIAQTSDEMQRIAQTASESAARIRETGEQSKQISSIVQTIREVAEQTNLLALNAAIEAARAGEHGRGFAVVADEVRQLAERTARATTDIRTMIDQVQGSMGGVVGTMDATVARVESGRQLTAAANASMTEIGEGARHAVASVNHISAALSEQGTAANAIAADVERIAQMVEENSAATRSASEAALRLKDLAEESRQAVSAFKV